MIENKLRNSDGSYRAAALELLNKLSNVMDQALEQYGDKLTLDGVSMLAHSVVSERLALKVALESDETDSWKREYEKIPEAQMPLLVLGIRYQDGTQKYVFKKEYNDYKLCHKTSNGDKIFIQGIVLTPYPEVYTWMENLRNQLQVDRDDVKRMMIVRDYQDNFLSKMTLYCNNSYPLLRKGIYPIDVDENSLSTLTPECDKIPQDLDELIDWEKSSNVQRLKMTQRWDLYILG